MTLSDDDLPATFRVADAAAGQGQRLARMLTAWELVALIAAAATSLGTWRLGTQELDALGGIGALAFAGALVAASVKAHSRPDDRWFSGRAAAESIKTLAWRFGVRGDPFAPKESETVAEERFLGRVEDIFSKLQDLAPPTVTPDSREVTAAMLELRSLSFSERKEVYLEGRVSDQISWYTRRAEDHQRLARKWTSIMVAASVFGLAMGLLKFLGALDVDVLGFAAAIASAATAWSQLNQHKFNHASYSVAARELAIIRDRGRGVDEDAWGLFVSDAEDAVSREHTMWLARHGHPISKWK